MLAQAAPRISGLESLHVSGGKAFAGRIWITVFHNNANAIASATTLIAKNGQH